MKLRDMLNRGWSDEQVGRAVRWLLMPRHASCVPDEDLWSSPPKYTTWHNKLGPWACERTLVWAKDLSKEDITNLRLINKAEALVKIALRQSQHYRPFAGAHGDCLEHYTIRF